MTLLTVWLLLAVAVGIGAAGRGRSGVGWCLLALLVSPLIAGVALLLLPPASADRRPRMACPHCAELIPRSARICGHCRQPLRRPPAAT